MRLFAWEQHGAWAASYFLYCFLPHISVTLVPGKLLRRMNRQTCGFYYYSARSGVIWIKAGTLMAPL